MRRKLSGYRLLANVLFVLAVLSLSGFGVTQVARRQWRVQRTFSVRGEFATIAGVTAGTRVRLQGIDAGLVERVVPPEMPGKPVVLVFRVDEKLRRLVRSDAVARIVSEGVVGAKVVEIVPGLPDAAPLSEPNLIRTERPTDLGDLMKQATASLARLDAVSEAAEKGLGEINTIAATVRKGEGSLGKLVQEDEAYRNLMSLTERGERTLHDLDENLAAMKRTWPISRYFNDRSFFDRDRVLYHPGAVRDGRIFSEADLFEPGRSVLTARGRAKLDEVAIWFKRVIRPTTEVVIAAFTDATNEPDLAQILTQEQADAVRKYLVAKHGIESSGWFSSRKVAAVGFGSEPPHGTEAGNAGVPVRRVEVILFTPQA